MGNAQLAFESEQLKDAYKTATTLVPLKSLRENFMVDLFHHVAVQTVFKGQTIFEKGGYDRQHIYLLHGDVKLVADDGHEQVMKARDSILPLSNTQPRQVRAIAATDTTILRVDSDRLDRTLSWSQVAEYLLSDLSLHRDYDEDIDWMQTVLNSNLFFKVPPVNVEQIFSRLTPMVVDKGEVIIRQGEIGDCCYFIKEGDALVTLKEEDNREEKLLAEIHEGRCFGEDALVFETVRNATVTMKTNGVLMRLEKSDFLLLLKEPKVDEVSYKQIDAMVEAPILVDVRTDEEYTLGHLPRAANIPLNLLSLKKRLLNPATPYLFYCDTGRRSRAAAYLLGKQGFNVMALDGGYIGAGLDDQLIVDDDYLLRAGALVVGQ